MNKKDIILYLKKFKKFNTINLSNSNLKNKLVNLPLIYDFDDDDDLLVHKKNNCDIYNFNSNDIEIIEDEIIENEIIEDEIINEYLENIPEDIEISINNIKNEKFVSLKIRFMMEDEKTYEMNIQIPEDVYFLICKKLVE